MLSSVQDDGMFIALGYTVYEFTSLSHSVHIESTLLLMKMCT